MAQKPMLRGEVGARAWHYPYGDPRRIFGQGMPKEVWYLMEQT